MSRCQASIIHQRWERSAGDDEALFLPFAREPDNVTTGFPLRKTPALFKIFEHVRRAEAERPVGIGQDRELTDLAPTSDEQLVFPLPQVGSLANR